MNDFQGEKPNGSASPPPSPTAPQVPPSTCSTNPPPDFTFPKWSDSSQFSSIYANLAIPSSSWNITPTSFATPIIYSTSGQEVETKAAASSPQDRPRLLLSAQKVSPLGSSLRNEKTPSASFCRSALRSYRHRHGRRVAQRTPHRRGHDPRRPGPRRHPPIAHLSNQK